MRLQLTELLTSYGDVKLIWFDGLFHQEKYYRQHTIDLIHKLQPATLVNDRIGPNRRLWNSLTIRCEVYSYQGCAHARRRLLDPEEVSRRGSLQVGLPTMEDLHDDQPDMGLQRQ